MIDKEQQDKLRAKYNPDGSDLRRAQNVMLELLIFLDKICKEYNLTYWLDGGTLLGAARHGGFIPWDDDTDVCMPREDARKLKKIMGNKVFENHIVLQNQSTDWNYLHCGWMTLRDLNTEYVQDSNFNRFLKYRGFQVDIFEVETGVYYWLKRIPNIINSRLIVGLSLRTKSPVARCFINFNARVQKKIIIPICRLFKSKNEHISFAIGNPFMFSHPENVVYPVKKISFEGHYFNCPNDVDGYLRIHYKDWESIPSENEIRTHDAVLKFLK